MTKETASTLLIQIFNTYSNTITANYKDGVIKEAFEIAVEALRTEQTIDDLIRRSDAIKAIEELPNAYNGWSDAYDKAYIIGTLEEVPRAEQTEPNSSEKPNNCEDCIWPVCNYNKAFEDEPQTERSE